MVSNNKALDHDNYSNNGILPRVAVFIDGSNLYHSMEENCKRYDVDFAALVGKLCKGRKLFRAYYYNVLRDHDRNPQAYQDQQKFLSALHSIPYLEVRLGASKVRGETAVEKGIDIMLATDLLKLAWSDLYDVGVVVSGDGDFAYAVQSVKDLGKHVEVAAFSSNLSTELASVADDRAFFTPSYFSDLWGKQRYKDNLESKRSQSHRPGWRLDRFRKNQGK